MSLTQLAESRLFGGRQLKFEHFANTLSCKMQFSVYLPPQAESQKVPALYWLSGLTCTDENFSVKAGAQRVAAELGIALIIPDTSPRGELVANDPAYDLGQGAGFYVNATRAPWSAHYRMYDYISSELPALDPRLATGKTVVMHLGSGASLCGLQGGRSAYTSMGFSPLDGLMMGTRCGSLDPMIPLYLIQQYQMSAAAVEKLLIKDAGLLGVSGLSNDMRDLEQSTEANAKLAIDLFVEMLARETGAAMASIRGLDGIVFTAGIGEHSPLIRSRVCEALAWAGVILDPIRNAENAQGARRISSDESPVAAWVIPTNEEIVIARDTWRLAKS